MSGWLILDTECVRLVNTGYECVRLVNTGYRVCQVG